MGKSYLQSDPRVIAVVPALNEEKSVGEVARGLIKAGIDVVVINDGSTDHTSEVAREAGAYVVDLPFNLGIGGAVQTGFRFALRGGYDVAIQVDGDGQHDPASIAALIGPIAEGKADMVLGSRFLGESPFKGTFLRRIGMVIFSGMISLIYGGRLTDTTSGYRAINRDLIALFADKYPSDYPEVEVLAQLAFINKRIVEVPVVMRERSHGSSSITLSRSAFYMLKVSLAIFKNIRLGGSTHV